MFHVRPIPIQRRRHAVPLVWICNPDPLSIRICNPLRQCTVPKWHAWQ